MIFKYIRDKQNRKIGVVEASLVGDTPFITWSLCNKKDRQKDGNANIERAMQIAAARRLTKRIPVAGNFDKFILLTIYVVPNSILSDVLDMRIRARKYFQTKKTLEQ